MNYSHNTFSIYMYIYAKFQCFHHQFLAYYVILGVMEMQLIFRVKLKANILWEEGSYTFQRSQTHNQVGDVWKSGGAFAAKRGSSLLCFHRLDPTGCIKFQVSSGIRRLPDDVLHPRATGQQLHPLACLHLLCHIFSGRGGGGRGGQMCESEASSNITSCREVPGWVPPPRMGSLQCGFHKKSLAIKRQRWANPPSHTHIHEYIHMYLCGSMHLTRQPSL